VSDVRQHADSRSETEPTFTPGRAGGVIAAIFMPVGLLVGWIIQFSALLARDFSGAGGDSDDVVLLIWFLVGASIGLGIPLVVLIVTVRGLRRDPRFSRIALVASIIVLVFAVPSNLILLGFQIPQAIEEVVSKAQPPTAAETHFSNGSARTELTELGDRTVEILGGDPDNSFSPNGLPVRALAEECTLENSQPGTSWSYSFSASLLVDGNGTPLLAEGEDRLPTATDDLDGVRAYWQSKGIASEADSASAVSNQFVAQADWLDTYSYARPGPDVILTTICLAD
jgi:hypothetical protein